MSDYILKFWPIKDVAEDKTQQLITELKNKDILGEEIEFWGEPAHKLSTAAVLLLAPNETLDSSYVQGLAVFVKPKDYGIGFGEEDFEYFDRLNVITVNGGDGELERSEEFCQLLYNITGDEYSSDFELL